MWSSISLNTLSALIKEINAFLPQFMRISPRISAEKGVSTLISREAAQNPYELPC